MFGERLVIPASFRKRCLHHLHRGHPGIQRMKAIARSYVYWPSLDDDIVAHVNACQHCAAVAKSPPKYAPLSWPKPTEPWQRVHVDYAGPIEGEYYLLCVDSYSKWVEIVRTSSITAPATISILRSLFARLGMPKTLVSDNGRQFVSGEFDTYCLQNGIDHLTTAPYHPQSNGQAERFVDTFKRSVKKIREGKGAIQEALDVFLLTFRTTPNPSAPGGKSPSEIMLGRKIRTSLDLLRPPIEPVVEVSEEQQTKRRSFRNGDAVYAKVYSNNKWRWAPGIVLEPIGRVMFNVWIEDKRMLRSHLNQLRSRAAGDKSSIIKPDEKLPLDILLKAWNLPKPRSAETASTTPSQPLPASPPIIDQPSAPLGVPSEQSSPHEAPIPEAPVQVRVSPEASSSSSSSSGSTSTSTSSSVASTSSEFLSANENPIAGQIPRRSSRVRRPPIRFDPYQLY